MPNSLARVETKIFFFVFSPKFIFPFCKKTNVTKEQKYFQKNFSRKRKISQN
jgi:hypothetical protein